MFFTGLLLGRIMAYVILVQFMFRRRQRAIYVIKMLVLIGSREKLK